MKQTVNGSCHCGDVQFSCGLDPAQPTVRCNCSICTKARYWLAPVPAADFQLMRGEDALADYRFGHGRVAHRFCRRCGVKVFGQSSAPAFGGAFFAVNVACLELTPQALADLPIAYVDGRHDAPGATPAITSYL
jgi:hypothetical protein